MSILLYVITIAITILIFWAIGNMGKNTILGVWGSIGLAIVTTPVIAFLIIIIFFKRKRARLTKIYQQPRR